MADTHSGDGNRSTDETDRPERDDQQRPLNLSRRTVLQTAGGTGIGIGIGVGAFAGTAAAHEVEKVEFCGCDRVTVTGPYLLGSGCDEDESGYYAAVYCDGTVSWEQLSGDCYTQVYDLEEDSRYDIGSCQIIAVKGETWAAGEGEVSFTICNEHCGYECAESVLPADLDCDDPDEIPTGGGGQDDSIKRRVGIDVTCDDSCLRPVVGDAGCTPGFWCNPAQRNGWWSTTNDVGGYYTDDTIGDIFDSDEWLEVGGSGGGPAVGRARGRGGGGASSSGGGRARGRVGGVGAPGANGNSPTNNGASLADRTLGEAVCDLSGGPDLVDAQRQLAGHATAALLNAAHEDIHYPMTVNEVIAAVQAALETGDRDAILDQKDVFDEYNNLGCSLDAHGNLE